MKRVNAVLEIDLDVNSGFLVARLVGPDGQPPVAVSALPRYLHDHCAGAREAWHRHLADLMGLVAAPLGGVVIDGPVVLGGAERD